ncbi:MAG: hypothetical protein RLZ92_914 [Pseudomonadota bacterium]
MQGQQGALLSRMHPTTPLKSLSIKPSASVYPNDQLDLHLAKVTSYHDWLLNGCRVGVHASPQPTKLVRIYTDIQSLDNPF